MAEIVCDEGAVQERVALSYSPQWRVGDDVSFATHAGVKRGAVRSVTIKVADNYKSRPPRLDCAAIEIVYEIEVRHRKKYGSGDDVHTEVAREKYVKADLEQAWKAHLELVASEGDR